MSGLYFAAIADAFAAFIRHAAHMGADLAGTCLALSQSVFLLFDSRSPTAGTDSPGCHILSYVVLRGLRGLFEGWTIGFSCFWGVREEVAVPGLWFFRATEEGKRQKMQVFRYF